jgi:gamma-glutamyltranspeptidase / glutathione hydrolase
MNDFSIPNVRNEFGFVPSAANYIRPGKRPMSSITPVIAEHLSNGTLAFVTGAAGGSRIISATAQVAWHLLEHGMNMSAAIAAPRLHDQLMPNNAFFEWSYDNTTVEAMAKKGHNVTWTAPNFSSVQGIRRIWNGTFEPAGETRQRNSGGLSI